MISCFDDKLVNILNTPFSLFNCHTSYIMRRFVLSYVSIDIPVCTVQGLGVSGSFTATVLINLTLEGP